MISPTDPNQSVVSLESGTCIPWKKDGIKVLGGAIGTQPFCTGILSEFCSKVEKDLRLLENFPSLFHRFKLATFCCNTRVCYLMRTTKLKISLQSLRNLDYSFESFYAKLFHFEADYISGSNRDMYHNALSQFRLPIRKAGFGVRSAFMHAPAALYTASCEFILWLREHPELISQTWLLGASCVRTLLECDYLMNNIKEAVTILRDRWSLKVVDSVPLQFDPDNLVIPSEKAVATWPSDKFPLQHEVSRKIEESFETQFLRTLSPQDKLRVKSVAQQTVESTDPRSDVSFRQLGSVGLTHSPLSLLELRCGKILSDQAFITMAALVLGYPVPHCVFLNSHLPEHDVFGDYALNNPAWTSAARNDAHNALVVALAAIFSKAGIPSSGRPSDIPRLAGTQDHGDIVTFSGGLAAPDPRKGFTPRTQLIADVVVNHVRDLKHCFKKYQLSSAQSLKNGHYKDRYRDQGQAFATAAMTTGGQFGPDLLRMLWKAADSAARRSPGMPLSPIQHLGPQNEDESLSFKATRGRIFFEYKQTLLRDLFEAVTERIYGCSFALFSDPRY